MNANNLFVGLLGVSAMMSAAVIDIKSTGLAAAGTVDPNWSISAPAGSAFVTVVDGFPIGPWLANSVTSSWIQPESGTADHVTPGGTFTYRTTFSLAGLTAASAVLNFQAASDNEITAVRLNGNSVGFSFAGFAALSSLFSVTTDAWFAAGLNTLEFDVLNGPGGPTGNPSGLRVDISGTADAPVPEPATFVLAGTALAALYLRRRSS